MQSTAYRCLCIAEIQKRILSSGYLEPIDSAQVYDDQEKRTKERNRTLFAMALTCKMFRESALDALWKVIEGVEPLVKCMPADLWGRDDKGVLNFRRAVDKKDYCVLLRYTLRIHSIILPSMYNYSSLPSYSPTLFETLSRLSPTPLLPRLKSLHCPTHREWNKLTPHLHSFVTKNLTTLTIYTSVLYQSFPLEYLNKNCPQIEQFHVIDDPELEPLESYSGPNWKHDVRVAVSNAICEWKNLRSVRCGFLTKEALSHLAQLPALHSLTLHIPDSDLQTSLDQNVQFHYLTFLELSAPRLDIISVFLDLVASPVQHFSVKFYNDPLGKNVHDLCTALARQFPSEHLKSVSIALDTGFGSEDDYELGLGSPSYAININIIRPLLCFQNLSSFKLGGTLNAFQWNDDGVGELARSWPNLRVLEIGDQYSEFAWVDPSQVTLMGLMTLLKHCPKLEQLICSFDASQIPKVTQEELEGCRNENLRMIFVHQSEVEDDEGVGRFLAAIAPGLCSETAEMMWYDVSMPEPKVEKQKPPKKKSTTSDEKGEGKGKKKNKKKSKSAKKNKAQAW